MLPLNFKISFELIFIHCTYLQALHPLIHPRAPTCTSSDISFFPHNAPGIDNTYEYTYAYKMDVFREMQNNIWAVIDERGLSADFELSSLCVSNKVDSV